MKISVSPANGRSRPFSSAALSTMRAEVVPTQTIRPPPSRAALSSLGGRGVDRAPLGMHLMVARIFDPDRRRRSRRRHAASAMERNATFGEALNQRRSEMQPRRRRRDRSGLGREHRLIVRAIAWGQRAARGDVGRQRRRAEALDRLVQRGAGEVEAQQDFARLALVLDLRVERGEKAGRALARLAEADALADLESLGRTRERPPAAVVDAFDQRRLDRSDRLASDPRPPRAAPR